jgi:hypothetical protein
MSANLRETLDGEYTLSFTVLAKSALALKTRQVAKLDGQYFEIVQISKSLQGIYLSAQSCVNMYPICLIMKCITSLNLISLEILRKD